MEHIKRILDELEKVNNSDLPIVLKAVMEKIIVRTSNSLSLIQSCFMDSILVGLEEKALQIEKKEKDQAYH